MTPTTHRSKVKDWFYGALQWGALLVAWLGFTWRVASAISATKLDVSTYQSDRRADSLIHVGELRAQSQHDGNVDRKLNTIICRIAPHDTECDRPGK